MSVSIFPLGQIVATPGALERLTQEEIVSLLRRHMTGDWGELCEEDRVSNDLALVEGGRLFSAYDGESDDRFWVITEADRSVTTILLPDEY